MIPPAGSAPRDLGSLVGCLTSPVTGIISSLALHDSTAGEGGLISASAELADLKVLGCPDLIPPAGGAAFNIRDALTRAVFEAIERYSAACFDSRSALWSRPSSPAFLCGNELPLFNSAQYATPDWPYTELTANSELWWSQATCLHSGATRLVPSTLVHIPFFPQHAAECIGPSISTGMAAGWTFEQACLAGLYEVCERDAFALMWARRASCPRLLPAPGTPLHAEVTTVTRQSSACVTFLDISNDLGVPAAAVLLRDHFLGRPIAAFGSSAKPSLHEACRKALAEAVAVRNALRIFLDGPDAAWRPTPDFSNVTDWKWHALLYTLPEFNAMLDFVSASPHCRILHEESTPHPPSLQALTHSLRARLPSLLAVDLTPPDIASLSLHAVKIFAPHAAPLEPDHRYRRPVPRLLAVTQPNPLPHPFF